MLLNSYARQSGKIWPFGAISILHNQILDHPADDSIGLFIWSEELIPFGKGDHYVKIINDEIYVFDKKSDQEIASISKKSLKTVCQKIMMEVSELGYLKKIGFFGKKIDFLDKEEEWNLEAIRMVLHGKKPPFYSKRAFYKVPESFKGSQLVFLCLDYGNSEVKKVFSLNGKEIQYQVEYPLKEKK